MGVIGREQFYILHRKNCLSNLTENLSFCEYSVRKIPKTHKRRGFLSNWPIDFFCVTTFI